MNSPLHNRLLANITKLQKLTADLSLEELSTFVTLQQYAFNNGLHKNNLGSPLKQGMYLLALASSQPEPLTPKKLTDNYNSQLVHLLESIFTNYGLAYFPTQQEHAAGLNDDWHRQREIAMPVFMHYFMSGFKASSEQIKTWINSSFNGFEKEITESFGVSHHELLQAGAFIEKTLTENFRKNPLYKMKELHEQFIQDMDNGIDYEEAMARARDQALLLRPMNDSNGISFEIEYQQLKDELGEKIADCILNHFTTFRGTAASITYITDPNPIIDRPLLTTDGQKISYLGNNSFYQAIIEKLENHLAKGPNGSRYLKERDRRLEQMTREHLQKLFPEDAQFFESAFDRPDSHGEHDLVIVHKSNVYIVEAKASPPKEPLRDPSKAALRIRDHFRGRNSIQKAYDQGNALRKLLLENPTTALYDKKGKLLIELQREQIKKIHCICVTRDDFGPIATNLKLLLEKDDDAPYPWVICITDLEFLADALLNLGHGIETIDAYLDQRLKLHGKVFGSDELEYFGCFLRHGGLQAYIEAKADLIPLNITDSDIFDDIHECIRNGERYELVTEPANLFPVDKRKFFGLDKKSREQSKAAKKSRKARQKQSSASRKKNRAK